MKNNKLLLPVLGLVLLSLLLAACGSTSSGEANFPTGKFIKSGTTNHALVFNEDGTFSVMEGTTTLVVGKYRVEGDTYIEESNNFGCPAMSFKYTFDGTNLTFNYVDDPAKDTCGGRRGDFDNQTFILSE